MSAPDTPRRSRSCRPPAPAALLVAIALATVAVVLTRARRLDREVATRVDALLSRATEPPDPGASGGAGGPPAATVTDDDLADLPGPVRRYLESVLGTDRRRVRTARLEQRGRLRVGGGQADWVPFEATQHVAVDPPGFLWDATVAVLPFLPARVVDAYEDGAGTISARLLSTVPVAAAGPNPEMDEGELLRYLAEAVWYPTALVGEGVSWEAIDDRSARATVEDAGNEASLVFAFDDRGLVESVRAGARYRQEDDAYAPWTGSFGDYEERNGLVVPTAAEVAWELPDGEAPSDDSTDGHHPYWRARIESIEHDFAG